MEDEEVMTAEETDFDDWDDIDIDLEAEANDEEPEAEAEPEADQQTDEPTEDEAAEPESEAEETKEEPPELFELKHLGETKSVSRDEVVTLAQKGLNYDHIREERDTARAEVARLTELENFLKEIAADSGTDIEGLVIDSKASKLIAQEAKLGKTLDREVARERIRLQREREALGKERRNAEQQEAENAQKQAAISEGIKRFAQSHSEVKAEDIPKEIWDRVAEGGDLSALWNEHENKMLKTQLKDLQNKLEAAEQNKKNAERSTGSRKTAGTPPAKDPWFDGWDDD